MSSNHGFLCRDLIGGSVQIKSQKVIDKDANLVVNNAKVKNGLRVKGGITANGVPLGIVQVATSFRSAPTGYVQKADLSSGNRGHALAFNTNNGLLYHFRGDIAGQTFMRTITTGTSPVVGPNLLVGAVYPGPLGAATVVTGAVYDPAQDLFLLATEGYELYSLSVDGTTSVLLGDFSAADDTMRGLGLIGSRLFGGSRSGYFYELNKTTAAILSEKIATSHNGAEEITDFYGLSQCGTRLFCIYEDDDSGGSSIGELNLFSTTVQEVFPFEDNDDLFVRPSAMVFDNTGLLWFTTGDAGDMSNQLFCLGGLCGTEELQIAPVAGNAATVEIVTSPCLGDVTAVNPTTGVMTYDSRNVSQLGLDVFQYTIESDGGSTQLVNQFVCHKYSPLP